MIRLFSLPRYLSLESALLLATGAACAGKSSEPLAPPDSVLQGIELTPATTVVGAGETQQFTAVGRMSDNSTSSVVAMWSATGGSISSGGFYTAGSTAGAYRVIAIQQGGTKADTSAVEVLPPPLPAGAVANPSLLPLATGQRGVSESVYTALPVFSRSGVQVGSNPRNMAVGQYYVDPMFGTNVVRLTSATFPAANSGAYLDYWEGGARLSFPWGTNRDWYTINVMTASGFSLVDFNLNTYQLTNERPAPPGAGELSSAFSLDPATPQILYTWSGSTIRKWNTAVNPASELTGGGFPKGVPGSSGYWFSMSKNDEWFVAASQGARTIYAWNRVTNTVTSLAVPTEAGDSYNEQKLDKAGRYVWVNYDGGDRIWDAQTGALGPYRRYGFGSSGIEYQGHAGVGLGYAIGGNSTGVAPWIWRVTMASLDASPDFTSATAVNAYENNTNAGWVTQEATPQQWYLPSNAFGSPVFDGSALKLAVGFARMDISEIRGVAHHYNTGSTGDYYGQYPWANVAPDGRLAAFVTNSNGGNRTDVMLVPIPSE